MHYPSQDKQGTYPQSRLSTPKSRRCFQRTISGLERGGQFRFLTLTSSKESSPDIHKHFRILMARLKRRGLVKGYIQVPEFTKSGLAHKHIIIRGSYIDQAILSAMWQEIHGAKIVDIRRIKSLHGKGRMANEMAKYMAKENALRYSWDWGWVWKGFCKDWTALKRQFDNLQADGLLQTFKQLLHFWRICLHRGTYLDPYQIIPLLPPPRTTPTPA
jgi:hypothetical protein